MMVPRRRGLLMWFFGGLDAKTITMLLMGLTGLAGSGVALKRGSEAEGQVEEILVTAAQADSMRDARIDSLEAEVERLKLKLSRTKVAQGEMVRLRKRAERRPWWKLWA